MNADIHETRRDLTVEQLCEAFGICRATAYKLINQHEVRSYKLRGQRRIPRSELQEYPARQLAKAEREAAA